MKVILEIKDDKAPYLMEILRSLSFVKAKPLGDEKALFLEELKESIDDVKLAKEGKKKLKNFDDFLKGIK